MEPLPSQYLGQLKKVLQKGAPRFLVCIGNNDSFLSNFLELPGLEQENGLLVLPVAYFIARKDEKIQWLLNHPTLETKPSVYLITIKESGSTYPMNQALEQLAPYLTDRAAVYLLDHAEVPDHLAHLPHVTAARAWLNHQSSDAHWRAQLARHWYEQVLAQDLAQTLDEAASETATPVRPPRPRM